MIKSTYKLRSIIYHRDLNLNIFCFLTLTHIWSSPNPPPLRDCVNLLMELMVVRRKKKSYKTICSIFKPKEKGELKTAVN